MEGHHPAEAADAFETALVYSRDNFQYRLKLTDALLASGATSEALGQLHAFWDQHPGDAQVNLKLARVEAQHKHVDEALRYYQNAIEGVWADGSDPVPQRLGVRFESAEFLVVQGRQEQAEEALLALAAVLPASSTAHGKLADLFLRNGDTGRALSTYQAQLNLNKNDATAILGAAKASYAAGSYAMARHYLEELKPETAESQALRVELERMEALDPFAQNVSGRVRTKRTMAAFQIAIQRLAACGVPFAQAMDRTPTNANAKDPAQWSGFAKWAEQLSPLMSERKLRGRDDVIESTMRFAFQAEMAAQKECGKPTLNDEALLLLARERMGAN
jgi:Tfp pilus assembly protein PilF